MRGAKYDDTIENLAQRLSALEDQAYQEFSDIFAPRIKGYFLRQGLTQSDAEDLSISCITDIALKIDKYKAIEGAGFAAWVFTLARHAMVDWLRKRQESLPYIDNYEIAIPVDDNPETDVKIIMAVREALVTLSEKQQEVLQMRYFGAKHSFPEIGEHLNMQADAVRLQHHRAIKKLESLLKEDLRLSKILKRAGVSN